MDRISAEKRSDLMRKIRNADTRPELEVRRFIHKMGFRYRLHNAKLPGKPDIVLVRHGKIIFVNGCFWHQHTCPDGKSPKSNQGYWAGKLAKNVDRDRRNIRELKGLGWKVLVVWECQLRRESSFRRRILCFLAAGTTI